MRRRSFLAASLVGPLWLRRAFGDVCVKQMAVPGQDADLFRALGPALRDAQAKGRPLLVLVVPADDGKKYMRGRALGVFLNHAEPRQLAPLGLTEVVCATTAELAQHGHPVAGEPWMVLVEGGRARPIDGEVPAVDLGADDALIDRQIQALARLVDGGIGLRGPADDQRIASLADEARARLVKGPPRGSYWALSSICGEDRVEGLNDVKANEVEMVDCGMGHLPPRAHRFLYFFTKSPRRRYLDHQARAKR
jgi:hypothetical protein